MKKFTNQNVLKETKNNNKIIIIGIIIFLFGIALGLWEVMKLIKLVKMQNLNKLLLSDEEKEKSNCKT
ncbi:MAG: hypothetical protein ACLU2J_02990 [Clostridia bacterium]